MCDSDMSCSKSEYSIKELKKVVFWQQFYKICLSLNGTYKGSQRNCPSLAERLERDGPSSACWNWGEWGLQEDKWKGSFLGWFVGLIVPGQKMCLGCYIVGRPSTVQYFNSFVPIAQHSWAMQPCWVARLLVCVSDADLFSYMMTQIF